MRKQQHQELLDMVKTLYEANDEITKMLEYKKYEVVLDLLSQCQDAAVSMGNIVEQSEGEGFITVSYLQAYCDCIYQIYQQITNNANDINVIKIGKTIRKQIINIENSLKNDIKIKKIAVFLPYKASMWDSLESVWMAANADPDCEAYVIPIPYFDRNADRSLGTEHYEADLYPDYVPITDYKEFDFVCHPDMIFIHNPYDGYNTVTSVHPFFYSDNLKKFTECLVYIPYFATAGGMSEGQSFIPSYLNMDYIVIQSEKYRKYYDERISDEKFLALGSPKFDAVITKCKNPPTPPHEWNEFLYDSKGNKKKVFFYNTSIGGMLENTENFIKKMAYVFDCFQGKEDCCSLWRPHPLMESTFDSMRPLYKPVYEALKRRFIDEKLGIFDTTPSIENTIAQCDYYIGDEGTSVTSLFGVAGKPIFILNNNINKKPEKDDWRGEVVNFPFNSDGDDRWVVTMGNKLWHSEKNDYDYKYVCDLCEYSGGNYYNRAKEINGRVFIFPISAQNILYLENGKLNKIVFEHRISKSGAFCNALYNDKYIVLIPNNYPDVVLINVKTLEVTYIKGLTNFIKQNVGGEDVISGNGIWNNRLVLASASDNKILMMDLESLQTELKEVPIEGWRGSLTFSTYGDDFWILPSIGKDICYWNIRNNSTQLYRNNDSEFNCLSWPYNKECERNPYGLLVQHGEQIVISPCWGNKFVKINLKTKEIEELIIPIEMPIRSDNGYFITYGIGGFINNNIIDGKVKVFKISTRQLYSYDIIDNSLTEIPIVFDLEETVSNASQFGVESEWMMYACRENVFNTLEKMIDDNSIILSYDKEKQLAEFSKVNASRLGDCGEKVYKLVSKK